MATFKDLLDRILNAVYGEEIRGAIHDGLEACHDEMTTGTSEVENARIEIEAAREEIADARVEMASDRALIVATKKVAEEAVTLSNQVIVAEANVTSMYNTVVSAETEVEKDRQEVAALRREIEELFINENYVTVHFYNEDILLDIQLVIPGSDAVDPVLSGNIMVPQKVDHIFLGWDKEFTNVTESMAVNALFGQSIALWDLIERDITGDYVNAKVTTIGPNAFSGCVELASVDFPNATLIGASAFTNCAMLTAVILRNTDAVCDLSNANAFTGTPIASGTGYIYVPSVLVDSYKSADGWSTYTDQIRAIEDYPEIYGGE